MRPRKTIIIFMSEPYPATAMTKCVTLYAASKQPQTPATTKFNEIMKGAGTHGATAVEKDEYINVLVDVINEMGDDISNWSVPPAPVDVGMVQQSARSLVYEHAHARANAVKRND